MSETPSFRGPREPPPDSPATVYANELARPRAYLDRLRVHHIDLTKRFLAVDDGKLYPLDLFVAAAMGRSYSTVDGFISAFDTWNPIVAAPLLRMQIDSLVRLAYMAHVRQADEVVLYVIGGGEFRNLRDSENRLLNDARLLEHAAEDHPWVGDVYRATSGWVHFSPEHFRAAWRIKQEADESGAAIISGSVPIRPEDIPLSALQELIRGMIQATAELFGYVEIWESRKGLPLGKMRDLESD